MKLKDAGTPKLEVTNKSSKEIFIEMYFNSATTPHSKTENVAVNGKGKFPRNGTVIKALVNNNKDLEMSRSETKPGSGLFKFEIDKKVGTDTISVVAVETDGQ